MKTLPALLLFFIFFGNEVNAQFNNDSWVFGDSAGIQWQGNPKTPSTFKSNVEWRNGVTNISDSSGIVLYSALLNNSLPINGYVWNKFHQPIPNANLIKGNLWYHAGIFLPDPGNDSIIYLFTAGVTTSDPYGLYYSKINYKANNDSGVVIIKNVKLNSIPAFDGLMAVRHGNGRDWWLVFQRWFPLSGTIPTNEYFIFLIDPSGVSGPFNQNIGLDHATNGGHLIFNEDGSKFAMVSLAGLIQLCDFDRCSGQVTSCTGIQPESPTATGYILPSCAFSPNERFLYITHYSTNTQPSIIWQYDLYATNINTSKLAIGSFNDPNMGAASILLAPDKKIYISACHESLPFPYPDTITAYTTINSNLSVINQPDSLGLACDFQPFSFYLGGARTYYGLPNNPNYELGAWVGSPCDTLTVGLSENTKNDVFFQAWYNGEWNMIHVNASKLKGSKGVLRLFDVQGRVLYEAKLNVITGGYLTTEINMNGIASGVYIVSLSTEKEKLQGKIMKY